MVDMMARHTHRVTKAIWMVIRVARIEWGRDMGHYRMRNCRCVFTTWNVMVDLHRWVVCMREWHVRVHSHHMCSVRMMRHHMR